MAPRTLAAAVVLAAAAAGCAQPGLPAPALRVTATPAPADLEAEVVPLTQALMRTRPVNPPGGEAAVVAILAGRLRAEGIEVATAAFAEGRENLMATLPGADSSLAPVVLLGHSDVVPADPEAWDDVAGPFDASVVRGELRGRGALDMLGMVALEALTLVSLGRQGAELPRDVVLLVVGDEEAGGSGVEAAIRTWPRLAGALVVLGEGGVILEGGATPGQDVIAISVAEKGLLWFDLVTRGPPGHGSAPHGEEDAPVRLARAVSRVLDRRDPQVLTPPAERMLAAFGRAKGGLQGMVLERPLLVSLVGRGALEERDETRVVVHDTCALTVLDAGEKTNVIPGEARASFDCRLLPGTSPDELRDELLLAIDDPRVELVVHQASPANGSPATGPMFDALRSRIGGELEDGAVVPLLTRGTTDNRFFRARGVPAYGLIPVRVTPDELASMHGPDERVRVAELKAGLSRLVDVVRAVAAWEEPASPEG